MSSQLLEKIGLGGLDIAYILIIMLILIIVSFVLIIVQWNKLNNLQTKYAKFMKGRKAKNLEGQLEEIYQDNDHILKEMDTVKRNINLLKKQIGYCYQKSGVVKYDAFSYMGGQLSFCIAMLDEKNDGFILNAVQSSEGCYTYAKEIKNGESSLTLSKEEKEALNIALKNKKTIIKEVPQNTDEEEKK